MSVIKTLVVASLVIGGFWLTVMGFALADGERDLRWIGLLPGSVLCVAGLSLGAWWTSTGISDERLRKLYRDAASTRHSVSKEDALADDEQT